MQFDEDAITAAASAAYTAFQLIIRKEHPYFPETGNLADEKSYLRECYAEMCRAAIDVYLSSRSPVDDHRALAIYFQEHSHWFYIKASRRMQSYNKDDYIRHQTRAECFSAHARYHVWRMMYPDAPHDEFDA